MGSALRTVVTLVAAAAAVGACARDAELPAPLAPAPITHRPDVAAPSSPPTERPDVLVVEIPEQTAAPAASSPPVEPEEAPTYRTAIGESREARETVRHYRVREGDWLVQISREQYGSASHAEAILEANREQIEDPDHLVPGQVLILP